MPCHCLSNSAQSWMLGGESARFPGVLQLRRAKANPSLPFTGPSLVTYMYRSRPVWRKRALESTSTKQNGKPNWISAVTSCTCTLGARIPHKSISSVPPFPLLLSTNFPAESNFNLESFHVRKAISATQTSNQTSKQSHNPILSSEHVSQHVLTQLSKDTSFDNDMSQH